jgi:hypothetical protein
VSVYYMNEAAFSLPELSELALADRTVTRLEGTSESGRPWSVLVHRSPLAEGQSLAEAAAAGVREARMRLRAHAVLWEREGEVSGRPALEMAVQWRGEKGMVYTRQAHVVVDAAWLQFACNAAMEDREEGDARMDHLLGTFRLRA